MKKIYLSILSITLLAFTSFGQAFYEEDFDYGASGALISVTSNWTAHSGSGDVEYDASTNLTMTGYSETAIGGSATISQANGQDIASPSNTTVTSGTIYASTLINITALGSTSGDYFFHLKDGAFGYTTRTYAKDDGVGNILFGVRESSDGTITYGTTPFSYNTTYLMVIKYDYSSGTSSVYILNSATTTEPGSPEVSDNNGTTAATELYMVAFRQGSNTPEARFDAIRMATTWEDLFPAVASTFTVNASSTDASCNGLADGIASITVTGGTSPYTYLWEGGSTTDTQDGLTAGAQSLMVTISDATTVTETATVNVTIGEPSAITISTTKDAATCGATNGSVTITAAGGSGSYMTYVWNNTSTTNIATGLASGTHLVTVTDTDNCSASASVLMNPSDGPVVTITETDITCNGANDGMVSLAVSGGTTPYTFDWSVSASTTESASGLSAGSQDVTVTDNAGCYTIETVVIAEPTALSATMIGTDETLAGASDGTLTATATGGTSPYTYAWTSTNTTSSNMISNAAAGAYTATVTDANGCIATTNAVTVASGLDITPIYDIQFVASNVPEVNDASPLVGQSVIVKGVVTAIINKGGTKGYWLQDDEALWSGIYVQDATNYLSVSRGDELMITGSVAEYYTSTQITTLTSFEKLSTGNTVNPVAISTLDSKNEAVEGVLVKVTNANCDTIASGATFGVWTVNDGSGPAEIENDIYSYGQEILNEQYDVTGVGYYTFSVMYIAPRDINDINVSCGYTMSSNVDNVTCNGADDGAVTITTTGATAVTYTWSHAGNIGSTNSVTDLAAGNYTVTVNGDGCILTKSYDITEPSAITVSGTTTNTTCGSSVGEVAVTAMGGSGVYATYSWSNSVTTASISGLGNGTYTVVVTDDAGCIGTKSFGVNSSDGPNVTMTETHISCYSENDGQIVASVSGGTTPYTFDWGAIGQVPTETSTTSTVIFLDDAEYNITVTDNTGCEGYGSATIINPSAIILSVAKTQESASGASDGTATATASGGTGAITYAWSNLATGASINGLTEGTYYVTATDANGCTAIETFEITNTIAIYDIQHVASNVPGTNDASPYENQVVKVKGVVTALINKGSTVGFWIQDDEALWSGIYVQSTNTPSIGDEVKVTATVDEFYTSTQLVSVTDYSVVSSGNTVNAITITTGAASNEDIEGVLVKVVNAECTEKASGATFGVWSVNDGSGIAKIENDIYSYGNEVVGEEYCVTGVGYYTFDVMFIAIRSASDVDANCTVGIEELTSKNINIYPNPSNGIVNITSNETIDFVRVIDLKGAIVYQNAANSNITTIDMNNFDKGIYSIQVVSGSTSTINKVILK